MAWGLSNKGFLTPNQAQLKEEIDQRQKELFGDNVNLSSKSPNGILSGILSWGISILWATLEKVYHNGHVSGAEGVNLDYKTIEFNTSRNPEQHAETTLSFTGTPNYTILAGTRYERTDGIDYALKEDLLLDGAGYGVGEAVSLLPGIIGNGEIGTITVQSEPSADVITVTNTIAATGGREEETDAELRNRLLKSEGSNGSGTTNAILADVLATTGVRAANVVVNNSDAVVNGQPAHSNHVFVLGGDGPTIADALFNNYVGLQFFGSNPFTVADIGGNLHTVAYTPATTVDIYAVITLVTNTSFAVDGIVQVKDSIVKLIGGTASDGSIYIGLSMGDDVTHSRILSTIMSVQGVTDATLKIGTSVDPTGTTNIVVANNTVAQVAFANIAVTV